MTKAQLMLVVCFSLSSAWGQAFPRGVQATQLHVISEGSLKGVGEQMLVATLQGLLARESKEQIYVSSAGGYAIWWQQLESDYGVSVRHGAQAWDLLTRFNTVPKGCVVFDAAKTNSINAATSMAGLLDAVAVDQALREQARAAGVTNLLLDVSDRDETWVLQNYGDQFAHRLAVEQKETLGLALRDYAVMAKAFVFFDGNSAFRKRVLQHMEKPGLVLGWGDAAQGEEKFIGPGSRAGTIMIPADHARNLSVLSGFRETNLQQRASSPLSLQTNVHTVCFVMTDGDNVQWNIGGMARYYDQPERGQFPIGWSVAPALADLAPTVLKWFYNKAMPGRDHFIAGPSGLGYFYPSMAYDAGILKEHARLLNAAMARGGLGLVQILDFNAFDRIALWDTYTEQPNIDALLYCEYSRYNGEQGRIAWSNGKPVIAAREMLWNGIKGADEESVIAKLNRGRRDPRVAEGYSLVAVHVWSKSLKEVKQVVDRLDPGVKVVPPDTFARLIRENVRR